MALLRLESDLAMVVSSIQVYLAMLHLYWFWHPLECMLTSMIWVIAALDAREVDAMQSCGHHCWPNPVWIVRLLVCDSGLAMLEFMVTLDFVWCWLTRCLVGMTLQIDKFCIDQTNIVANLHCHGWHVLESSMVEIGLGG